MTPQVFSKNLGGEGGRGRGRERDYRVRDGVGWMRGGQSDHEADTPGSHQNRPKSTRRVNSNDSG